MHDISLKTFKKDSLQSLITAISPESPLKGLWRADHRNIKG